MVKSANITTATLHCSISFGSVVTRIVRAVTHVVRKVMTGAIGGAKQLQDRVAIATDTPPPLKV